MDGSTGVLGATVVEADFASGGKTTGLFISPTKKSMTSSPAIGLEGEENINGNLPDK